MPEVFQEEKHKQLRVEYLRKESLDAVYYIESSCHIANRTAGSSEKIPEYRIISSFT